VLAQHGAVRCDVEVLLVLLRRVICAKLLCSVAQEGVLSGLGGVGRFWLEVAQVCRPDGGILWDCRQGGSQQSCSSCCDGLCCCDNWLQGLLG